jgi:hypothetical protein
MQSVPLVGALAIPVLFKNIPELLPDPPIKPPKAGKEPVKELKLKRLLKM